MIISTNSIKDVDLFGEVMRDIIFGSRHEFGLGCYQSYKFPSITMYEVDKDNFDPTNPTAEIMFAWWEEYVAGMPDVRKDVRMHINEDVFVGWHCDGMGVLMVSDFMQIALNMDCKQTKNWRWI